VLGERQDLAGVPATAEVALLRSIALGLAEAAPPLPAALSGQLDDWVRGGWLAGEAADRDFPQGYLAGLEAAARHCEAAAERCLEERRRRWNPLRRGRLGRSAAQLRSMAGSLRLMARGIRPNG
jgi:hypothetical protein